MDRKEAEILASDLIRRATLADAPGLPERAALVTRDALAMQAEGFLPDGARHAIARRDDETYVAVALEGSTLYEIEGLAPEGEASPGRAKVSCRGIDTHRDRAEAEMSFQRNTTQQERRTTWHFSIADLSFSFQTAVDETEQELPASEEFAHALARALGWKLEQPAKAFRLRALTP